MSMIARMSSEKLFWVKDQSVSRLNLVLTFLTSLKTARLLSLSPGALFLVCGCKDRAKLKYNPNLMEKIFPETAPECIR